MKRLSKLIRNSINLMFIALAGILTVGIPVMIQIGLLHWPSWCLFIIAFIALLSLINNYYKEDK